MILHLLLNNKKLLLLNSKILFFFMYSEILNESIQDSRDFRCFFLIFEMKTCCLDCRIYKLEIMLNFLISLMKTFSNYIFSPLIRINRSISKILTLLYCSLAIQMNCNRKPNVYSILFYYYHLS